MKKKISSWIQRFNKWLDSMPDPNAKRKVYWHNPVDSRFTGIYDVIGELDGTNYIVIHNEKVGNRTVPRYYVEPYDPNRHNADRTNEY